MRRFLGMVLLLLLPALARAQDSVIVIDPDAPPSDTLLRGGPPPGVGAELIRVFNDSGTTRVEGDLSLPAGSLFEGRLAVHRGTLRIAGRVNGPVIVAHGTIIRYTLAALAGRPLDAIRNGSISTFRLDGDRWEVLTVNGEPLVPLTDAPAAAAPAADPRGSAG